MAADLIELLRAVDTPTVCNVLEELAPERRAVGFNRRPLTAIFPAMRPIVGYARTATIRSLEPNTVGDRRAVRLSYYEYIERGPRPSIAVIQDIEGPDRGIGAFWGEVQTNVHRALGCIGTITDGSVRDIDQMAKDFFVLAGSVMPSHVYADIAAYDVPVTVAGMLVNPGDLIHADRHGAVVIPAGVAAEVPKCADLLARREKVLLDAAARPDFSTAAIREAFDRMSDIH